MDNGLGIYTHTFNAPTYQCDPICLMRVREGMGREGMGREGMGREGMGREGMGREGMGEEREVGGSQKESNGYCSFIPMRMDGTLACTLT
jgi:hypothetical protein